MIITKLEFECECHLLYINVHCKKLLMVLTKTIYFFKPAKLVNQNRSSKKILVKLVFFSKKDILIDEVNIS